MSQQNKYSAEVDADTCNLAAIISANMKNDSLVFTTETFIAMNTGKLPPDSKGEERNINLVIPTLVSSGHIRQNRNGDKFYFNLSLSPKIRIRNLREALAQQTIWIKEYSRRLAKPDVSPESIEAFTQLKTGATIMHAYIREVLTFLEK